MKSNDNVVKIHIPSELGYEKVAMNAVAVIAKKMDFGQDKIDDLKTAVGEACTNAIEHGNSGQVDKKVSIVINFSQDSIRIDIIDSGLNPLPDYIPDRMDRTDFRGLGLYLMQQLVDRIELVSQPDQNTVRLLCLKTAILAL